MKRHTIAASLIVGGLCLASAGRLSADNISYTSPDPSKHHHYANPAGAEACGTDATGATGTYSANESGYSTYQGQGTGRIIRARSLIGMNVKNEQNERLGEVRNIVVDQDTGRINFVLVEKAHRAKGTPPDVAVPAADFRASSDLNSLVLNIDKDRIAQAR